MFPRWLSKEALGSILKISLCRKLDNLGVTSLFIFITRTLSLSVERFDGILAFFPIFTPNRGQIKRTDCQFCDNWERTPLFGTTSILNRRATIEADILKDQRSGLVQIYVQKFLFNRKRTYNGDVTELKKFKRKNFSLFNAICRSKHAE